MNRVLNGLILGAIVVVTGCGVSSEKTIPGPKTGSKAGAPESPPKPIASPSASPTGGGLSITPENTKIEYVGAKEEGKHTGGFNKFTGAFAVGPKGAEGSQISVDIDTDSIFSDNPKLTQHLKSPDFFEVKTYPKASFKSTSIKTSDAKGATHTVAGDLTLHGVTKAITFPATIKVSDEAVSLDSDFKISRKEFGIVYGEGKVFDDVAIKVALKLPRK